MEPSRLPPFVRGTLTILLIVFWYAANIITIMGNKYLLSNFGFNQPIFLTLCHMTACTVLGLLVANSGVMPLKPIRSRNQAAKIAFLAVLFCSTIVLGNASLKYLPVSFNQAVGSTTPFFTAVFAFLFQGIRESILSYLALIPVIAGVAIASGGEPLFHALGFVFCLTATAGRALKTVVQAMLMSDPSEKLDPMSLLLYMSAFCVAYLVPMCLVMEPGSWALALKLYAQNWNFAWWMAVNAGLAYATNLLNFLVTKWTSALTLQVLGNAKGVVAAVISVLTFGNPVTAQGIMGYAITVAGVVLYSEAKRHSKADNQGAGKGSPVKGVPSALGTMQPSPLPTEEGSAEPNASSSSHGDLYFRSEHSRDNREGSRL